MAIKTQTIAGQRRVLTKVTNGVRRVSCSCCPPSCFCSNYDLDLLLYGEGIGGLRFDEYLNRLEEECGDIAAWEALQPDGRYTQRPACLRWLCRRTVLQNGQPVTISNSIGGPTTNNRDLNDLLFECLGEREGFAGLLNGDFFGFLPPEEYGQCYLYGFEFYGWHRPRKRGPQGYASDWVSSDFLYDVYRRDTAIPEE
jgi:hypothetical protein